ANTLDRYARVEGYALVVIDDTADCMTITELVAMARQQEAAALLIPARTRMARFRVRLNENLDPGASCRLVGASHATSSPTPPSDLSRALTRNDAVRTSDGTR